MLTARVYIQPKQGVLDPQGKTVQDALGTLGFTDVRDVRIGRYVVLTLDEEDEATARSRVRDMCEQLLANGVIEEYRVDVGAEDG